MRSPRDPLIVTEDTSESENYQNVSLTTPSSLKQSGPSSAKSRSSESSGYMSRSGEKSKRSVARESSNYAARSAPNPLRKLAHTNSTSSLKVQSNRSSSSLTSKEAEFQAWKRRKNYDPLKSATRYLLAILYELFNNFCTIYLKTEIHQVETLPQAHKPRVPTHQARPK